MTSALGLHHSSYAAMQLPLVDRCADGSGHMDTCELCQVTPPVPTFIQVPRMMLLFRDVTEWRPAHLGVYQNDLEP